MAKEILSEVRKQRQDLKLPSLIKREFQMVDQNETNCSGSKSPDLRIMQWNLLAQGISLANIIQSCLLAV
jgi:hypothetical protein